jgi:hypothetical protein
MDQQLRRIGGEADRDQAWCHRLFESAADGAGKVGLRGTLQRYLPGNRLFVDAVEFAFIDHVAADDRPVGLDDAGKAFFELSHVILLIPRGTFICHLIRTPESCG